MGGVQLSHTAGSGGPEEANQKAKRDVDVEEMGPDLEPRLEGDGPISVPANPPLRRRRGHGRCPDVVVLRLKP